MKTFNEYFEIKGIDFDTAKTFLHVVAKSLDGQERADLLSCIRDIDDIANRQKAKSATVPSNVSL